MEGRVALVTGGTKGIGFHIAQQLGQKGINLVVAARTEDKEAIQQLQKTGVTVDFVAVDVASDKDIEKARDFVNNKYGKLDILVNNAALANAPNPNASQRDHYLITYNANVAGVAVIMDTFYELLKKSAHPRIVNVSSTYGSLIKAANGAFGAEYINYRVTKAALNLLTIIYSQKFKEIKVNAVCPGYCKTAFNGFNGTRDPALGALAAVKIALIEDDGPTGGFFEITDEDAKIKVADW